MTTHYPQDHREEQMLAGQTSSRPLSAILAEIRKIGDEMEPVGEKAERLAKGLEAKFRDDFVKFADLIDSEEVPRPEFLAYWERDPKCQEVIKEVFLSLSEVLKRVSRLSEEITVARPTE